MFPPDWPVLSPAPCDWAVPVDGGTRDGAELTARGAGCCSHGTWLVTVTTVARSSESEHSPDQVFRVLSDPLEAGGKQLCGQECQCSWGTRVGHQEVERSQGHRSGGKDLCSTACLRNRQSRSPR